MRRFRSFPILVLLALAGCTDFLADPAPPPATIALSPVVLTDAGAAFDQADRIDVRVTRGEIIVADGNFDFSATGSETRISVEVEIDEDEESLGLEVTLRSQGDPLFTGSGSVLVRRGQTNPAEITLEPVAARIDADPTSLLLTALGETAQLSAQVVFATGHPVPGRTVTWSTGNPGVVQVTSTGTVTAIAEGTTSLTASSGSLSAEVPAEVRQAVEVVRVLPATATVEIGGSTQLAVELEDAGGSPISPSGRSVDWSSSDPSVATVENGRVEGVAQGEVTVTATVEGVSGTAQVTVQGNVGTVVGRVVDGSDGTPIAGAEVVFEDEAQLLTSSDGTFEIVLPQGNYSATVTADDYSRVVIDDIEVRVGGTIDLGDIELFTAIEFEGVWAYDSVDGFPDANTPDYLVVEGTSFRDVEFESGCYHFDPVVELVDVDGDIHTFIEPESGSQVRIRMTLDGPNRLVAEQLDFDENLTFRFNRSSLTVEDLVPRCNAAWVSEDPPRGIRLGAPGLP
jgi:hypothetical protein